MTTTAGPVRSQSTPQLAADLGHLLDRILDGGEHDLVRCLAVHDLTPLHARVLRELRRCSHALTVEELAVRMALNGADVLAVSGELRRRRLVARRDAGSTVLVLTGEGRRVVLEIEGAHRHDLNAYVDDLDRTGRRRLEAALSLLDDRV